MSHRFYPAINFIPILSDYTSVQIITSDFFGSPEEMIDRFYAEYYLEQVIDANQYALAYNLRHGMPAEARPAHSAAELDPPLPIMKDKGGRPRKHPDGPDDPVEYQKFRRRQDYYNRKYKAAVKSFDRDWNEP